MKLIKDPKPVVLFPADVLRAQCELFGDVSQDTKELSAELRATLSATTGIGLAAPQIGISKRMILLKCDPKTRAGGGLIMINPEIVETSDTQSSMIEGCLSLPGERFSVTRPDKVMVEYLSETGRIKTVELDGLAAKCVQHEIDHLNGILIMDRSDQAAPPSIPIIGAIEAATVSHFPRSR
jgi:peptide deformylase